jgi:hypothetical protein
MKPRVVFVALFFLLPGQTAIVHAQEKIEESDYYPFKIGTKWNYKVGDAKIIVRIAKHEKVGDVTCALVETVANDRVVATEHVSVQKEGLFRHTMAGQKADPAVLFLKLPPKKGDTWKVTSKVAGQDVKATYESGEEEITVPAGKYKTVVTRTKEFQVGDQKLAATIWYAKNVGMVKTIMTVAGNDVTIELEKFEPAK